MSNPKKNENFIDDWQTYLRRSRHTFQEHWQKDKLKLSGVPNFKVIKVIGEGSFGCVVLAKNNNSYYAVKIIKKNQGVSKTYDRVLNEIRILRATNFPFIIHMSSCFSDSVNWYFTMPFIPGGDLWEILRRRGRFPESVAQFYASQVLLALEYLHYLKIIYRDLKPENILIDVDGYIKLADFGFCKKIGGRTYSFCGTTEYIAPEVILSQGYGFSADWWSFGVLIYEMCRGHTPFLASCELTTCKSIVLSDYKIPNEFSDQLRDLIKNLIQKLPNRRLGSLKNRVEDIKNHSWFVCVDWLAVLNRKLMPPSKPFITQANLYPKSKHQA